jgi:hypothetical protein
MAIPKVIYFEIVKGSKAILKLWSRNCNIPVCSYGGMGRAEGVQAMSCKDTIHLICWYLEGKLSTSVAKDIERHLESCSNCQLVLNAATTTLEQYFAAQADSDSPATSQAA